jgi:ketosteroid isomerase-like protein
MVALLRRNYDAINRRDYDAVASTAHPDVVLIRPGGQPDLRGVDAVRAWLEPDAFESQELEPVSIRIEGNKALAHVRGLMKGAGSGIEIEAEVWSVWTFDEDGKVIRVANFLAHEEDEARSAFAAST